MSCKDCVFRGTFQDMGASFDVCNLQSDLVDADMACRNSESCRHRFTTREAKKIVMEREGELPKFLQKKMVIPQEKNLECEVDDPFKTIKDALEEFGKSAFNTINSLARKLQEALTESEDTQND